MPSKQAEGFSIDTWDRVRLSNLLGELEIASVESGVARPAQVLLNYAVKPAVSVVSLRAQIDAAIEKRSRGTLGIGKVVEELVDFSAIYYPYYEAEFDIVVTETQRVGILKKEVINKTLTTRVTFDGPTGSIAVAAPQGFSYSNSWLSSLTEDEAHVMRFVGGVDFNLASLAPLGLPDSRVKRAVAGLRGKGCVSMVAQRPAAYRASMPFPTDPCLLRSLSDAWPIDSDLETHIPVLSSTLKDPGAIRRAIDVYWRPARFVDLRVIQYPYFVAVLRRADGSLRTETVDGMTGLPCAEVNAMMRVYFNASNTDA